MQDGLHAEPETTGEREALTLLYDAFHKASKYAEAARLLRQVNESGWRPHRAHVQRLATLPDRNAADQPRSKSPSTPQPRKPSQRPVARGASGAGKSQPESRRDRRVAQFLQPSESASSRGCGQDSTLLRLASMSFLSSNLGVRRLAVVLVSIGALASIAWTYQDLVPVLRWRYWGHRWVLSEMARRPECRLILSQDRYHLGEPALVLPNGEEIEYFSPGADRAPDLGEYLFLLVPTAVAATAIFLLVHAIAWISTGFKRRSATQL